MHTGFHRRPRVHFMHLHSCMRTCTLVHMHPSTHIPSCISAHKFIRAHMHMCTRASTRTNAGKRAFSYPRITRALMHRCADAPHTCTYVHTCAHAPLLRSACTHAHKNTRPPSHLYGRTDVHMRACTLALAYAPHSHLRTLTLIPTQRATTLTLTYSQAPLQVAL